MASEAGQGWKAHCQMYSITADPLLITELFPFECKVYDDVSYVSGCFQFPLELYNVIILISITSRLE